MENYNVNLGVNKLGKNIKKNHVGNNIKSRNRYPYPQSEEIHIVHKDDFKSFVQHMTAGKKVIHSKPPVETTRLQKNRPPPLSIVRPLQVPAWAPIASNNPLPTHPLQPDFGPPLVENSQTNIVESPMMDFGNSSDNQFHPLACQTEITNNVNVQYQAHHLASQTQVVNNIEPFPMNNDNQFVNGFPSPQTNGPQSPTSEFPMPWPTSNMNLVSPQTPYSPLLSPSLYSSPSSPDFPFPLFSPLSAAFFPF